MIETWKLKLYDGLEMIRSNSIQLDAPKHFHEGFSIGISLKGLQTIQLQTGDRLIPPGSMMFLNPCEVHAHRQIPDSPWSHQMIYISPEYIRWLQRQQLIVQQGDLCFDKPLRADGRLHEMLFRLHSRLTGDQTDEFTTVAFNAFIAEIFNRFTFCGEPVEKYKKNTLGTLEEIRDHLHSHFRNKLNLDDLSTRFKVNKFRLIRSFKHHTGVTPNEYLTIVRIEAAKKQIAEGSSIVSAALESGFYDQSHFAHSFLKYTCFTPRQFQQKCR